MKSPIRISWLFWVGVALALVASLISVGFRHRVEARNKAVMIVLEDTLVRQLATDGGRSFEEVLGELKSAGVGALVVQEQTLRGRVDGFQNTLIAGPPARIEGPLDAVQRKFLGVPLEGPTELTLPLSEALDVTLGPDPEVIAAARNAGVKVIARYGHRGRFHPPTLRFMIDRDRDVLLGYLPGGDKVMGFRSELKATNALLTEKELFYLSPEFAKIAGEETMVRLNPGNTIRLHAIQAAEADRLSLPAIVERFSKAFAERNMRVLLLRNAEPSATDPVGAMKTTLAKLEAALKKEGGVLGQPKPFLDPGLPGLIRLLIAAGVAVSIAGVVMASVTQPLLRGALMIFPLVLIPINPKYTAFAAALWLPIAAFLWMRQNRKLAPGVLLLGMVGICLTAGLCVAGLLNGVPYFVKADTFIGVKVAHFLPLFVIGLLLLHDLIDFRTLWDTPLKIGTTITAFVGLGVLGYMITRTGNDGPGGVSGIELAFRSALEQFLVVRPRTKEFLIGHPALFVGIMLQAWAVRTGKLKALATLLLVVGVIGLTSIINTMCHLHTPVQIGLTRIGIGLLLGFGIGALAWVILSQTMLKKLEATS